MSRPIGRLFAAGLLLCLGSACSSSSSVSPGPAPPKPSERADLVAKAGLDPCPSSSAQTRSHLPDVTLPCLGRGPAVHLAGLAGRPVVLNIWGSWCRPCQQETSYLAQVADATKGRVQFLGVDTEDDPNSALDFATHVRPPMRYPSVLDDNKVVLTRLGLASAVPSTVFVTASGAIAHISPGPFLGVAQLRAALNRYLGVRG